MDLAYGVFLTVMDVLTQARPCSLEATCVLSSISDTIMALRDIRLQRWKQRNLPSTLTIGEDVKDQLIIVTGPTRLAREYAFLGI